MAVTSAIPAKGTLLQLLTSTGPDVWTTVAEVVSIDLSVLRDMAEATHLNSPSGAKEFVGVERDMTISFDINHLPRNATHDDSSKGLQTQYVKTASDKWRIVLSDGGNETWTFNGWSASFSLASSRGDVLRGSVTLQATTIATIT